MQILLVNEQCTKRETYAQAKKIAEQQISTLQAKTAGRTLLEHLQAGIFYTATSASDAIPKHKLFIIKQNERKSNQIHTINK